MHPYATAEYSSTLSHLGKPFEVPEWGTHVIVRPIPGGGEDVVGCYPICIHNKEADVEGGLRRLKEAGFVSATLVFDDFHRPDRLPGLYVREFKRHYLHEGHQHSYTGGYRPTQEHR